MGGQAFRRVSGQVVGWAMAKFVWLYLGYHKVYEVDDLVGTLVRRCRCARLWYDLDLTFDIAVVTLSLKVLVDRLPKACRCETL